MPMLLSVAPIQTSLTSTSCTLSWPSIGKWCAMVRITSGLIVCGSCDSGGGYSVAAVVTGQLGHWVITCPLGHFECWLDRSVDTVHWMTSAAVQKWKCVCLLFDRWVWSAGSIQECSVRRSIFDDWYPYVSDTGMCFRMIRMCRTTALLTTNISNTSGAHPCVAAWLKPHMRCLEDGKSIFEIRYMILHIHFCCKLIDALSKYNKCLLKWYVLLCCFMAYVYIYIDIYVYAYLYTILPSIEATSNLKILKWPTGLYYIQKTCLVCLNTGHGVGFRNTC